jgi:single-stranded-DNA-specific exonuclease
MHWEYSEFDDNMVRSKAEEYQLSEDIIKLLLNRGIGTKEEIEDFVSPDISKLRDPFKFEKMEELVSKILSLKNSGEKLFVYGDYDVDGITAAAFLTIVFRQIGIDADYYIPNRMEEGYGLNRDAIKKIHQKKGKLIITVDTGVNSKSEIECAKKLGIDIVITDHHKIVKDENDEGLIIINPKFSKNYEFKYLSGAGVAFKVAQAVYMKLGMDLEKLYQYLDIVMIGTVADVVPMIDENRILIKKGLEVIKRTKIKGMTYLLKYLKLEDKELTTTDVSFFISPLLNALGRIGNSQIGVEFFLQQDDFLIYNIIEEMKKSNKKRRKLERKIFNEIDTQLAEQGEKFKYLFLKSKSWHPGIIGVVSSRLAFKYNVPTILISLKNGVGKASCRSVEGINIFNLLTSMADKFVRFGGHDLASGFIARLEDLDEIENRIGEYIEKLENSDKERTLKIDYELPLEKIDDKLLKDLRLLSPYGLENNQPMFLDRNLNFDKTKKFGVEDRHFKTYIQKSGKLYSAVAFNLAHKIDEKTVSLQKFDIIYYPEKIKYRGEEILQIKIKDLRFKDEFFELFTR